MRKTTQKYIVFAILFLLGLFQAVSGFVLWFVLPRGDGPGWGAENTFLALSRHEWGDLHNWAAVALAVTIIIHLTLNWKWIVSMTKSYFKEKA